MSSLSPMPSSTGIMARLGEATNRTLVLPIVMFSPTQRCNSACTSCSWWKTPHTAASGELSVAEVEAIADDLVALGTRLVVFTGGEPLLRSDVFELARVFRSRGLTLHLLTSALALEARAADVAAAFSRVIVSLDAADAVQYRAIRGVDGFDAVCDGIRRLRAVAPHVPVGARCTIHARNFRDMSALVKTARELGCANVSFLAADVRSSAFGDRDIDALQSLRLSPADVTEFRAVLSTFIRVHARDIAAHFIAESADKLRALAQYYAAVNGDARFVAKLCNAPWMSAVIEANGDVRPCFFHDVIANVRRDSFVNISRTALPSFRAQLDVATNATCERCVCSLKLGWRDQPWM